MKSATSRARPGLAELLGGSRDAKRVSPTADRAYALVMLPVPLIGRELPTCARLRAGTDELRLAEFTADKARLGRKELRNDGVELSSEMLATAAGNPIVEMPSTADDAPHQMSDRGGKTGPELARPRAGSIAPGLAKDLGGAELPKFSESGTASAAPKREWLLKSSDAPGNKKSTADDALPSLPSLLRKAVDSE